MPKTHSILPLIFLQPLHLIHPSLTLLSHKLSLQPLPMTSQIRTFLKTKPTYESYRIPQSSNLNNQLTSSKNSSTQPPLHPQLKSYVDQHNHSVLPPSTTLSSPLTHLTTSILKNYSSSTTPKTTLSLMPPLKRIKTSPIPPSKRHSKPMNKVKHTVHL